MKKHKKRKIKRGTVVVFEPKHFNPEYWDKLPEEERIEYYGPLGYGAAKLKLFVYITKIRSADGDDSGHCVLISLDDQSVQTMRHTCELRPATDDEF